MLGKNIGEYNELIFLTNIYLEICVIPFTTEVRRHTVILYTVYNIYDRINGRAYIVTSVHYWLNIAGLIPCLRTEHTPLVHPRCFHQSSREKHRPPTLKK